VAALEAAIAEFIAFEQTPLISLKICFCAFCNPPFIPSIICDIFCTCVKSGAIFATMPLPPGRSDKVARIPGILEATPETSSKDV
jgi:hypothetical protein